MKTTLSRQNDLLLAFAAFFIVLVLWQFSAFSSMLFPLRMFVTFIHELGHGLAAILTGGEFLRFEVQSNGAGVAYSRGGVREIIIPAGYMGTALFGASLLIITNRVERPQAVATILGMSFIGLTFLYSGLRLSHFNLPEGTIAFLALLGVGAFFATRRTREGYLLAGVGIGVTILLLVYFGSGSHFFTVLVGILWGIGLMILGWYGRRNLTLLVLNFLAFTVGLNAITDAWVLLQIVSGGNHSPQNDATAMASEAILPAPFWALSWMIFAVVLLGGAAWWTFFRRRSMQP